MALALQEAIRLAKEQQAQLRIAHVVDEATLNWPEAGDVSEIQETFLKPQIRSQSPREGGCYGARGGLTAETRMFDIETFGRRVADMIAVFR